MGVILMLLASASFTTMAAILKAVGSDIPLVQLIFLRSVLSVPILFIILVVQGKPLVVKAKKYWLSAPVLGWWLWGVIFMLLPICPWLSAFS